MRVSAQDLAPAHYNLISWAGAVERERREVGRERLVGRDVLRRIEEKILIEE